MFANQVLKSREIDKKKSPNVSHLANLEPKTSRIKVTVLPNDQILCSIISQYMYYGTQIKGEKRKRCNRILDPCDYVLKEKMYCETSKGQNGACVANYPKKIVHVL